MSEIQQLWDENNIGFGAEETNSLLDNPNLAAVMKMLELQLQVMVIPIVKRIVGPMMENMVRKVVKEEFERAQERFITGEKWKSADEGHTTQLRCLELQFLDKVSVPVYTGKEIKGEGGNYLTVALVDPLAGSCVNSGPEASAKVEIIVCAKDADEVDGNFKHEESEDMGRPLLSRNHLTLKEGIAVLDNIKFKNKAKWTKTCEVSLVARVANLNGITVKEAETESFLVMDCRRTLYKKHYPPSLSDHVWRLEGICRGGQLHKRLSDANINRVEEFLISLNMNPQSLKAMLNISAEKFKVIVDHAQTCMIGENLYLYNSTSCERKVGVVFNIVGCLRGLCHEDKYVPIDKLSEDEKVDAHKIMVSAFEHLDDAESIENEAFIAHFISQSSNANGAETASSPRTEIAAGSSFSHNIVVSAFEHLEDVECMENDASITHFVSRSSTDSGADTSSFPRTVGAAGSNFGWKMIDESDNALPSTVPRHLSPTCSFGPDFFDGFDLLTTDNVDILSRGIGDPIHSRTGSEDFGDNQHLQFLIEQHSDERTSASDSQITGASIAASSVARRRWRMAIRIVGFVDIRARKKQRLH